MRVSPWWHQNSSRMGHRLALSPVNIATNFLPFRRFRFCHEATLQQSAQKLTAVFNYGLDFFLLPYWLIHHLSLFLPTPGSYKSVDSCVDPTKVNGVRF
ncbi:hypothetical protein AVEN_263752-1 [Araneus ventricosus]|uniref:Uncharacterized protein n=1 Tax=Araneus ventricosus TaxID=182803 RepID=A0A4Y2AT55_ARAVE|nr:hypothetical protein AVEN_263752-1 [Araneus ventricosus]